MPDQLLKVLIASKCCAFNQSPSEWSSPHKQKCKKGVCKQNNRTPSLQFIFIFPGNKLLNFQIIQSNPTPVLIDLFSPGLLISQGCRMSARFLVTNSTSRALLRGIQITRYTEQAPVYYLRVDVLLNTCPTFRLESW